MQTELTQSGPLLDPRSRLTQVGWSRRPLLDCNLENAHFHRFRVKRFSTILAKVLNMSAEIIVETIYERYRGISKGEVNPGRA